MARIRTIKPAFWTDEKLAELSPFVRMTFLGLISAMADDEGRCKGDVRLVKASVWPLDDSMTSLVVDDHLQQLTHLGRIHLYSVDGARYIQIANWKKHQRIDKPRVSELPPPSPATGIVVEESRNPLRAVVEASALDTDTEGNGNGIGSGAEEAAPLLSQFPQGVVQFMAMFYEPALRESQRERYRDVLAQLWDAADPKHPGPKIRGGQRVKARDMDHLDHTCRRVMKDPPRERDKAVVFVLQRLLDPPPGPTPAERHKADTEAAIGAESAYQRAAKAAGVQWAKEHPDEYAPIVAASDSEFPTHATNDFMRMAREAALVQRCSRASGFPDFDTWNKQRATGAA